MFDGFGFMQDGTSPHKTKEKFEHLPEHFHDTDLRLTCADATGQGIDCSAYPPDFNSLDYFL